MVSARRQTFTNACVNSYTAGILNVCARTSVALNVCVVPTVAGVCVRTYAIYYVWPPTVPGIY